MLALSAPVVMAEIGWMAMGIVDTMMVGRIGAEAIGAVSLGSIAFFTVGVVGMGILLGLDTLVSQAFGGGDLKDGQHSLLQGVYLSFLLTPLLMSLVWAGIPFVVANASDPTVAGWTASYMRAVNWSVLPLLLYAAFRRYLQAINLVRPVMLALVSANVINAAANWILVFGNLGAPRLGAEGAGWATVIARVYMAGFLLLAILLHDRAEKTGLLAIPLGWDTSRIRRIVALGSPAAGQILLEVGVFAAAAALIARLDPLSLAAHQIALSVAGFTFMVPLGISSAAAVRVGQAIGRRDFPGAARSGWTGLALGASFMSCSGIILLAIPGLILRAFTNDYQVIQVGVSLMFMAALFQLFDGLQVVATGALRGLGDTRTPMLTNLVGHWALGLPFGYFLCFEAGWGAVGMWAGLCLGLVAVGSVLLVMWRKRIVKYLEAGPAMAGIGGRPSCTPVM
jgi:multidrug resistance protein, MATE family